MALLTLAEECLEHVENCRLCNPRWQPDRSRLTPSSERPRPHVMDAGYIEGVHANHSLARLKDGFRDRAFDVARATSHDEPLYGRLARFCDWQSGMDDVYRHIPSQHCDPLQAMEGQCRWQCTEPRQNTHDSYDKAKYYKPARLYGDTARARGMDASRHRDRTLARFCAVLWSKSRPLSGWISITRADVYRLLERLGLADDHRRGGLTAIARRVGLTKRQREAFVLWPRFSQEEIAGKLGITQEAVSQRQANALERCRHWAARTQNLIPLPLSSNRDVRRRAVFKREIRRVQSADLQNLGG